MTDSIILSRYEVARIIGLRALQIDEGASPYVDITENDSSLHIATRELYERKLDVAVARGDSLHSVQQARFPKDLEVIVHTLGD